MDVVGEQLRFDPDVFGNVGLATTQSLGNTLEMNLY